MKEDWVRNARVLRVIDGDTVELEFDLGFRMSFRAICRLYGINAPEIRGASKTEGNIAKDFLCARMELFGWNVIAKVYKDLDKYGRWLVELSSEVTDKTVNQSMIDAGVAKPWDGKGQKPV